MNRLTRLGVYGLAVSDGRILLARISQMVPGGVGKWTLPGGGMEWGETAHATLVREMYEETSLVPVIGGIVDVRSFSHVDGHDEYHVLQAVYRVEASGDPRVTEVDGSVDDVSWHPLAMLDRLPRTSLLEHIRAFL